jgi:hypothetical protein
LLRGSDFHLNQELVLPSRTGRVWKSLIRGFPRPTPCAIAIAADHRYFLAASPSDRA